jgi:hypothetical protein
MLPNLQHLHHEGDNLHDSLLRHCPITRLSANPSPHIRLNYNSLKMSRGQLTHLSVNLVPRDSVDFFQAMVHDAESFRNLQHIGTFVLNTAACQVSRIIPRDTTAELFKVSM